MENTDHTQLDDVIEYQNIVCVRNLRSLLLGQFLQCFILAKLVYSLSDLESLKHSLSISWAWSINNQLPLDTFKFSHIPESHQIWSSKLILITNDFFMPIVMIYYIEDLGGYMWVFHTNTTFTVFWDFWKEKSPLELDGQAWSICLPYPVKNVEHAETLSRNL